MHTECYCPAEPHSALHERYLFEFAVMNNGSLETHLEVPTLDETGNPIRNDAAESWIGALNDIKQLYQLGYFPGNTLTAADAQTVTLFAEGEAAFLIDGSWQVGYLTEHHSSHLSDFAVSCVPAKGQRLPTEAIGGISMGYFITRKAWEDPEKREAAVEFVMHLTSDEVLSTFIRTEVTALKDSAGPEDLTVWSSRRRMSMPSLPVSARQCRMPSARWPRAPSLPASRRW